MMSHNQPTACVRRLSSNLLFGLSLGMVGFFASDGFAASDTPKDTYYINDHLASTVAIADAAGEIAQIEADAFGAQPSGVTKDSRFTGKPYDEDMGAYVFPFRNYRPEEARWMTADPSGFPDGVNGRVYAASIFTEYDALGLTGKSLLYIYFKANGGGISPEDDATLNKDIYANVKWLNDDMNYDDGRFLSSTHYLDDGDTLSYSLLSSLNDFSNTISSYSEVFIIAHGNTSGTIQQRLLNGVWYDESTVQGWSSKIKEITGCSIQNGGITANEALTTLEAKARSYLKDHKE